MVGGVELSPAQRKEKWRRNKEELGGGGEAAGWVQVRRGKNLRQRESLDKDKDKTDATTTNKQDLQDTPAGWRIQKVVYIDWPEIESLRLVTACWLTRNPHKIIIQKGCVAV
jgi:hypothetical protein